LVLDVLTPEFGNENEDFGRDTVGWGKPVTPGTDQAEDLGSVLLESLDLRGRIRE